MVNIIRWIRSIFFIVYYFRHGPHLNVYILYPLVNFSCALAILTCTPIYLKLVAVSFHRVWVTFDIETISIFKVWTNNGKVFPALKHFNLLFMIAKIILPTCSGRYSPGCISSLQWLLPINDFLGKEDIKIFQSCLIEINRSIIIQLLP